MFNNKKDQALKNKSMVIVIKIEKNLDLREKIVYSSCQRRLHL